MLASDAANPAFVGAVNPDAALIVEFYKRPVQDMFKSSLDGRPIFSDVDYVKINVPGLKDMAWDMPARSDHKQRFPLQWQHYVNKTQGDAREIGTPIQEWQQLTRSQAEEFRALKFYTVESIASASDLNINSIGMIGGMSPYALREKARAFLKAATDAALPQHQAEELAKRDAEIQMLKEQIAQIAAQITKPATAPQAPEAQAQTERQPVAQPIVKRKGPGRPSNAEIAARKAAEEAEKARQAA